MENNTCLIPANFTDAGKLFGMFPIRNAIECGILLIPLLGLVLSISPFGLTGTLIISLALGIPAGGFAMAGIHDHTLFSFLRLYLRFKKRRGVAVYRGQFIRKVKTQ